MAINDINQITTVRDLKENKEILRSEIRDVAKELGNLRNRIVDYGGLPPERLFYSPKEVAAIAGVSARTITRWCSSRILAATQAEENGIWLIHKDEIDRLEKDAKD